MAAYTYKQVTHRDDYLTAIALWQEQSGRESDEDPGYDGDCWLVTECLLDQKDADLARVTAERDGWEEIARTLGEQSTSCLAGKLEAEAENSRLRAALAALFVATKNLKLRQGILEAAEAALRGEVAGV